MIKKRFASVLLALALYFGLWNGHIALWDTDAKAPVTVFPFSQQLYPEADQHALQNGIPIENGQDLIRLIEDYLS